jgi:uncharacterized membrane protein
MLLINFQNEKIQGICLIKNLMKWTILVISKGKKSIEISLVVASENDKKGFLSEKIQKF